MALTIRQHKIAALKLALRVIIKPMYLGNYRYGDYGLCNAIRAYEHTTFAGDPNQMIAIRELRTYIVKSLNHHILLQDWLMAKGHIKHYVNHRDLRMVATRVAWIGWMIQCLEEDEANGK